MCPTPGRAACRCRANVHVFPIGRVETLDLVRAGETIARVQGTSCREDGEVEARGFHRDAHGLFTIGVAYGTNDSPGHEGDRVHYMALGGRHVQQTVDDSPASPTTAARRKAAARPKPARTAARSSRSTKRAARKRDSSPPMPSAGSSSRSKSPPSTRSEQLHERMVERLEKLQAQHPGIDLFVRWTIRGTGPLVNRLRPGGLADELLVDLRRQIRRAVAGRLERVDRLRFAAQRAGRMVRPGNVPRRFPARRSASSSCTTTCRSTCGSSCPKTRATIRWPPSPTSNTATSARELLCRAAKLGVDLLTLPLEEGDIPLSQT